MPYDRENQEFSPHAWGWTDEEEVITELKRVFPTRVGVDLPDHVHHFKPLGFPHTRGGGPATQGYITGLPVFSPHAWGWTETGAGAGAEAGVFPTRVGVDLLGGFILAGGSRFPHTRGGGPKQVRESENRGAFSPHAWGWTGQTCISRCLITVFPTRVGVDL